MNPMPQIDNCLGLFNASAGQAKNQAKTSMSYKLVSRNDDMSQADHTKSNAL